MYTNILLILRKILFILLIVTQDAEAVVDGDKDHVFSHDKLRPELLRATSDVTAAVEPHHHREQRLGEQLELALGIVTFER